MLVTFADVDDVAFDVRADDEDGILVSADVETLALADSVELGSFMPPCYLAVWVGLVTRFLDVMLAGAVNFRLETQGVVPDRLR